MRQWYSLQKKQKYNPAKGLLNYIIDRAVSGRETSGVANHVFPANNECLCGVSAPVGSLSAMDFAKAQKPDWKE